MKLTNVKYTTKLAGSIIALCLFLIGAISARSISDSKNGLYRLGEAAIDGALQAMCNSLLLQNDFIKEKLSSDSVIFSHALEAIGPLNLASDMEIVTTITDQESTASSQNVRLHPLKVGDILLNGNDEFVDRVQETIIGGRVTLFQIVDGEKLLRVATNVKKADGTRAVGTYIPASSPVTQSILSGRTYEGRANVVGEPYLSRYVPLRDAHGALVGALFVGRPILSEQVRSYIDRTRLGKGYFFLYDEKGTIVLHPSLRGKNIYEIVPDFARHESGRLAYVFNGEPKVTYTMHIEPWKLHLGFGLNKADIVNGLDRAMLRNNLILGIVGIVISIGMTVVLVRSINRPLKELAQKAVKVGEGDYRITFSSEVNDAIGMLGVAMSVMVAKMKNVFEEIIQSSQALSASSTELSAISRQMEEGASSTVDISEEVSHKTEQVAANMNAVAAAMEQSTTNLTIIASATEEMGVTTREIAENGSKANGITVQAVERARRSEDNVNQLGDVVRGIGRVADTITEISDQTNLLALNATIEAARAGEAGRGFAVVANEIKELARQTATATGEIKDQIAQIQLRTGETVEDIASVTAIISDVNDIVATIATAVEEQSATTSEIVKNVTEASRGVNEINEKVADSSLAVNGVSTSTADVRARAQEVSESSGHVTSASEELAKMAERLTSLVGQFKI